MTPIEIKMQIMAYFFDAELGSYPNVKIIRAKYLVKNLNPFTGQMGRYQGHLRQGFEGVPTRR